MIESTNTAHFLTTSAGRSRRLAGILLVVAAPIELVALIALTVTNARVAFAAVGLAVGLMLVILAIFSLRDARQIQQLVAEPRRVTHLIPIEVRATGVSHFPVMVATDDGGQVRVATGTRSAAAAIALLQPLFPHATVGGDDTYARGNSAERLRLFATTGGSMGVALFIALAMVTPRVVRARNASDLALKESSARNLKLKAAFAAAQVAEVSGRWSACSFPLTPSVEVLLGGFKVDAWGITQRSGFLIEGSGLLLQAPTASSLDYTWDGPSTRSLLIDALTRPRVDAEAERVGPRPDLVALGSVEGDTVKLRVVDLSDGKVKCEGRTSFNAEPRATDLERDRAIAAATMRPLCAKLGPRTCAEVGASEEPAATLSADAIQAVIRQVNPSIRGCYERALAKQPRLAGTLTVAFSIAADGSAQDVRASTLPSAAVSSCVVALVRDLSFPAQAGRAPVKVSHPFVFRAGK